MPPFLYGWVASAILGAAWWFHQADLTSELEHCKVSKTILETKVQDQSNSIAALKSEADAARSAMTSALEQLDATQADSEQQIADLQARILGGKKSDCASAVSEIRRELK